MALSEVESIRLVESSARYLPTGSQGAPRGRRGGGPLHVQSISLGPRGSLIKDDRLRVLAKYRLVARRGPRKTPAPALRLAVTFEILYKIPPDPQPSPEEISAFCNTNAMLNSWPYWREFVQNTVSRMNLPPLTLPLFRLSPPIGRTKSTR
jgi:hypothetical protein